MRRAETGPALISGTITDASGAVVPNVSVTATETIRKQSVPKKRMDGHYLFSQVNPGAYQITVQASGFATAASEPTPAEVGPKVALNFSLHPASSNQTVEVTAQQGLFGLDNPKTTTIEAKEIKTCRIRTRPYLPRAVRARGVDEHRWLLQRCEGTRRLWQC